MASGKRGANLHGARFSLWGFFWDASEEAAFRVSNTDQIRQRARLLALIGGVLFAAALPHDYQVFAGQPVFFVLLSVRLGAIAAAIALVVSTRPPGTAADRRMSAAVLGFEAYILAAFGTVAVVHGGAVSFHMMGALVIVLVLYVFLPSLSWVQFALPALFSALFLLGFALTGTTVDVLFIPSLLLLLVNALGLVFARVNNRTQRTEYLNLSVQRRLNEELRGEIAEREAVERRLRESDDTVRRLFDAAPLPLVLSGLDSGLVIRANDLALDLFGVRGRNLTEMRARDFYPVPDERDRLAQRVASDGHVSGVDARLRTAGGESLEVLLAAGRLEYYGQPAMLVGVMDNSTQKRVVRQFKHLANIDPLTGINNRRAFFLAAERELRHSRRGELPLSVMLVDADDFKGINDRFGHATGDSVLRAIADTLQEGLRESDVLGRVGGEEFAVLLPGLAVSNALEVAERLRERVTELRFETEAHEPLSLTVSIGVAGVDHDGDGIDGAFSRADRAMYAAKREGRNRVGTA